MDTIIIIFFIGKDRYKELSPILFIPLFSTFTSNKLDIILFL